MQRLIQRPNVLQIFGVIVSTWTSTILLLIFRIQTPTIKHVSLCKVQMLPENLILALLFSP